MDKLVIKPWSWRGALFGLLVNVLQWLLLYMWLAEGLRGAGNVVMAWNGFLAVTGGLALLIAARPVTQASRPGPAVERLFSRGSNVCFCLLMAWLGLWWMLVARLVATFGFSLLRHVEQKAVGEWDGRHG